MRLSQITEAAAGDTVYFYAEEGGSSITIEPETDYETIANSFYKFTMPSTNVVIKCHGGGSN